MSFMRHPVFYTTEYENKDEIMRILKNLNENFKFALQCCLFLTKLDALKSATPLF